MTDDEYLDFLEAVAVEYVRLERISRLWGR